MKLAAGTRAMIPLSRPHCFPLWIAVVPLLLTGGCGQREPPLFPVRGKVLFQGKPIPEAEMIFHPLFEGPDWMPVAVAEEDGSFAASTKKPGDGVLAGRYKVTVVWHPGATRSVSSVPPSRRRRSCRS